MPSDQEIIDELNRQTAISNLLAPQPDPNVFNTVTGEVLPPAQQNTINPNDPAFMDKLRGRSELIDPQTPLGRMELAQIKGVRRAQLVDPDPDRQYLDQAAELNQPARRAQLIRVPPGTAPRAQLVDPDPDAQYFNQPEVRRAQLIDPDPDAQYLDQGTPAEQGVKKKSLEQPIPSQQPAGGTQASQTADTIDPDAFSLVQPPVSDTIDPDTYGIAPKALPPGSAQPVQRGEVVGPVPELANMRSQFSMEMEDDPRLRRTLMASINAEVGDQGPEAKLAYVESVMNRAIARNQSLYDTITDQHYYPTTTTSKLGRKISTDEDAYLTPIINSALQGSNLSNYATGNESGDVHSGGAPVTYNPHTGERFVMENPDVGWNKGMRPGGAPAQADQGITFGDVDQTKQQELMKASYADQAKQLDVLKALPEQQQNYQALVERLAKPVPGVNDYVRNQYLSSVKQKITQEAQDYYGIKDPDEAYKKATSGFGLGDIIGEVVGKWKPKLEQQALGIGTTLNQLNGPEMSHNELAGLARQIHPEATDDQVNNFIQSVVNTPAEHRGAVLSQYADEANKRAGAEPGTNPLQIDIARLQTAAEALTPERLAETQKARANMQQVLLQNNRDLRQDPRIANTPWQHLTQFGADAPTILTQVMTGGTGVGLMLNDIFQGAQADIRAHEPGLSNQDVIGKAAASTLLQAVPAIGGLHLLGHGIGAINERIAQLPFFQRILAGGAVEAGTMGVAGAIQQVTKNIAEGRPIGENVDPALLGGIITGGVFGAGRGALTPRAAEVPRPAEAPPGEVPAEPPAVPGEVPEEPRIEQPPADQPLPPADEGRRKPSSVEPEVPVREEEVPDQENAKADAEINRDNERMLQEEEGKVAEVPQPVDVIPGEQVIEREPEPVREVGQPAEVRPDVLPGERGAPPDQRGAAPGGGENVPQERERVPGSLEAKLPADQRAALQPLVDDVASQPRGTPESRSAVRKLFEEVYKPFKGIFDRAGISRYDNPVEPLYRDLIAAADVDGSGNLRLLLGHNKIEDAVRAIMERGNDPVEYLRRVLNEELTHHAENIELRNRWQKATKQGKYDKDFIDYKLDHNRDVILNWQRVIRRERAKNTTDSHALANEMEQGLRGSMRIYGHHADPDAYLAHLFRESKKGDLNARANLSNVTSEMARQMLQLRPGHGELVETVWRRAIDAAAHWYQTIISGLKSLYSKLGPGQELERTHLAKLVRGMERELNRLYKAEAKGKAAAAPTVSEAIARAEAARRLIQETPGIPEKTKEDIGLQWKRFRAAIKGGEDAMLDNPETQALANRIKRRASVEQRIGSDVGVHDFYRAAEGMRGRWNPLADPLGRQYRANRDAKVKEAGDYIKARETGQPLPAVSPEVDRYIKSWDNLSSKMADEMERLGMKVIGADGKIRDFKRLGYGQHWPRMMTREFNDIVDRRNTTRKAEFQTILNDMIRKGAVKDEADFIDKFSKLRREEQYGNDHFSNMERGRQLQMPLDHTDFSPQAALQYASRGIKKLAQVESFGQKLTKNHKDAYDLSMDKVEKSKNLSDQEKQIIFQKITELRNAEYNRRPQGDLFSKIGDVQTGLLLGNWGTSMGNLIGGAGHNLLQAGPKAFLKAVGDMPKWRQLHHEAENAGILKGNFGNIMNDLDVTRDQNWMTRGIKGFNHQMLKWGGQHLTEDINRVFSLQAGRHWLNEFAKNYHQDTAQSRFMKEQATRLGIKPSQLDDLALEHGNGTLSEELLRNWVMQTHGSYDPAQASPLLFHSPVGKIMTKFGTWSANAARFMTREYALPLGRSIREWQRNPSAKTQSDALYHIGRSLGFLATAMGAGQLAAWSRNLMLNRDSRDPKYTEILKRLQEGDNAEAFQEFVQKGFNNVILSSVFGSFGDVADMGVGLAQGNLSSRTHNPQNPPLKSAFFDPIWKLGTSIAQEHKLSPKALDQFLSNLSSQYRVGETTAKTIANRLNVPFPWDLANQQKAANDATFLRQHVQRYESENPVLQQQRQAGLKQPPQFGGGVISRNVASATKDDINAALLTGHGDRAVQLLNEYIQNQPAALRADIAKSFKSYIQSSNPLAPGGSHSAEEMQRFLAWAKDKLPEEDARQLFASATTYAKAAIATGIFTNKSGLAWLARQDYDKFQPQQFRAKSAAAGAKLLREIQRQSAASALMNR